MPKYIAMGDLVNALGPSTMVALYDDDNNGVADTAPVNFNIDRAESRVDAFLMRNYTLPLPNAADRLVREAAIEFAVAYSLERHPEYVRNYGEEQRAGRWERALDILKDIASVAERLPDEPIATVQPGNYRDAAINVVQPMFVANPDGTDNRGDF